MAHSTRAPDGAETSATRVGEARAVESAGFEWKCSALNWRNARESRRDEEKESVYNLI